MGLLPCSSWGWDSEQIVSGLSQLSRHLRTLPLDGVHLSGEPILVLGPLLFLEGQQDSLAGQLTL